MIMSTTKWNKLRQAVVKGKVRCAISHKQVWESVLVSCGCCNKLPQGGSLKQHEFLSSTSIDLTSGSM
jgi:hypothetical protein